MFLTPSPMMQPPLLRTKIAIPRIPPEFVRRSRLTEQVNRGVAGPLTLLSAPAGFGKTHLLIEWSEQTRLPVAWLTLDGDDNEPDRFFHYLIAALQTLEPELAEDVLDFILSTRGGGLKVGWTLLINEISALGKEIVLVLDDFQLLENAILLEGLGFFVKQLPRNLHLVIACRGEPALDLAFLRAKGRVVELDADDLRFSGVEVAQFYRQTMGLQLPPETLRVLEERTEGWITGLQMAAISLRHQGDTGALLANLQGDAHILVDFLAEEVLDRQPEEIRQFLLRTSILEVLTGSLCEAVAMPEAQPGYGAVMLNRLEHANLFISALDEKHDWFRYHHLFTDFLRHIQAEINPAENPVLQKRAALWFERNGNLNEAFRYAFASADLEWTAELIRRNVLAMVQIGEISALTRWIGKLPKKIILSLPGLSIAYAWGLIVAFQPDSATDWIEEIEQALVQAEGPSRPGPPDPELPDFRNLEERDLLNFRGGLGLCKVLLSMISGDFKQAGDFSKQATSYLGEESPFIQSLVALDNSLYFILSGDTKKAIVSLRETVRIARQANNLLVMIIATCQLADMQALQGNLSQAWATLEKVQYLAVGPDGKPLPLAELADAGFGEILLERDSLEQARAFLENRNQTTRSLSWLSNLDGMISLAHLRQIQGDYHGAQGIIDQASRLALGTDSSQWDDTIVSAVAVRMALQRNDLPAAIQWWNRHGLPDFTLNIHLENYPYHIYEYLMLTQIRLLIAIGKSQRNESTLRQALGLLDTLRPEAEHFQRVTSLIEILIQRAIVQSARGEQQQAAANLRRALALGEPEGYRRIYLDGGQPIADLLAYCQANPEESGATLPTAAFVASLQASLKDAAEPLQPPPTAVVMAGSTLPRDGNGMPVSLSVRELEVLHLIAEGKSNQEISTQLYLALNTVKRHAYNIYAKLGVKNRTQAVSRARQLDLIP